MHGKFVYSKDINSIALFRKNFWQRYSKKGLKFSLNGKSSSLESYFISAIAIKQKLKLRSIGQKKM